MRRYIPIMLLVLGLVKAGFARDWSVADFDTLLYHAQRYGDTEERRENKAQARAELFERGADSLRFLMEHVAIENSWIRLLAQELTFQLPVAESVAVLRDFMSADESVTRKTALFLMSLTKPDPSMPGRDTVINVARARVSDEEEGGAAIRLLGKWEVSEAVTEILTATDHNQERRRIAAVNALRDLGDPAAIPALIARLDDEYFTVRYPAARALRALGDPALTALEAALPSATLRQRRHIEALLHEESCQSGQME